MCRFTMSRQPASQVICRRRQISLDIAPQHAEPRTHAPTRTELCKARSCLSPDTQHPYTFEVKPVDNPPVLCYYGVTTVLRAGAAPIPERIALPCVAPSLMSNA